MCDEIEACFKSAQSFLLDEGESIDVSLPVCVV